MANYNIYMYSIYARVCVCKMNSLYSEIIKTQFLNSSCIAGGKRGIFSELETVLLGYRYNLYVIVSILRCVYRAHYSVYV